MQDICEFLREFMIKMETTSWRLTRVHGVSDFEIPRVRKSRTLICYFTLQRLNEKLHSPDDRLLLFLLNILLAVLTLFRYFTLQRLNEKLHSPDDRSLLFLLNILLAVLTLIRYFTLWRLNEKFHSPADRSLLFLLNILLAVFRMLSAPVNIHNSFN